MTPQQREVYAVLTAADGPLTLAEITKRLPQHPPGSIRKQTSRLTSQGAVTRAHDGRYVVSPSQVEAAPETPPQTALDLDKTTETETRSSPRIGTLADIPAYRRVEDALPVAPLRAVFRLAIAFAFVRSQQLEGCEVPAIALAGEPGVGKTMALTAAALLLTGHRDDIADARQLSSAAQLTGRRQSSKDGYTLVPSVLLYPPDRDPPPLVCLDEIAEAKAPVLDGASLLLRLEPSYVSEGVTVEIRAALTMTYNKPDGTRGYWQPFEGWPGARRRLLVCDLDPFADMLLSGGAKHAAREIFGGVLSDAALPAIDLDAYRSRAAYPTKGTLETLDKLIGAVFAAPNQLPLGDPVLRSLSAGYTALFGLSVEAALTSALADVALIVGTTHDTLTPGAAGALNAALKRHDLTPVELRRLDDPPPPTEGLELTPEQKRRIGGHLARYAARPTPELLGVLAEYRLARRVWRPIRLPRYGLELLGRLLLAIGFTLFAALQNVAIAPALKLPRVSGSAVSAAWGYAVSRPSTRMVEYQTPEGEPLDHPRAYVLSLFGDTLEPRQIVELEDAA
ncbi:MAG: hypothetical protein U5L04_09840 [Trueperaceae bacterium]|nr:hypothetical protein [Trueperaceae bacterium]